MDIKKLRVFYVVSVLLIFCMIPLLLISVWFALLLMGYLIALEYVYYSIYKIVRSVHGRGGYVRMNWLRCLLLRTFYDNKEETEFEREQCGR